MVVISSVVAVVSQIFNFVFVLLPIYGLVGSIDSGVNTTSEASLKLDASQNLSNILNTISLIALVVLCVFLIIGLYKDVRKKSKK